MTPTAVIILGLYFLPTLVAMLNRHHNATGIFLLNLLLGWSILGWIAALIWSVCKPAPLAVAAQQPKGYLPWHGKI